MGFRFKTDFCFETIFMKVCVVWLGYILFAFYQNDILFERLNDIIVFFTLDAFCNFYGRMMMMGVFFGVYSR